MMVKLTGACSLLEAREAFQSAAGHLRDKTTETKWTATLARSAIGVALTVARTAQTPSQQAPSSLSLSLYVSVSVSKFSASQLAEQTLSQTAIWVCYTIAGTCVLSYSGGLFETVSLEPLFELQPCC